MHIKAGSQQTEPATNDASAKTEPSDLSPQPKEPPNNGTSPEIKQQHSPKQQDHQPEQIPILQERQQNNLQQNQPNHTFT